MALCCPFDPVDMTFKCSAFVPDLSMNTLIRIIFGELFRREEVAPACELGQSSKRRSRGGEERNEQGKSPAWNAISDAAD